MERPESTRTLLPEPSPNPPRTLPEPSPNPPRTLPEPSPNPPRTLPEPSPNPPRTLPNPPEPSRTLPNPPRTHHESTRNLHKTSAGNNLDKGFDAYRVKNMSNKAACDCNVVWLLIFYIFVTSTRIDERYNHVYQTRTITRKPELQKPKKKKIAQNTYKVINI